jgi:PEP-CTERM motif
LTASILLACGILLSPASGRAAMMQFAGPTANGGMTFEGAAGPYPAIPVNSITYAPPYGYLNGQCVWINSSLNNYIAANQVNGTAGQQLWSYSWANAATEALYQSGMTVTNYFPYVTSVGQVNLPNGYQYPAKAAGQYGGAVFSMTYTPNLGGNGAPAVANPLWIQAYEGTLYGTAFGPILDNGPIGQGYAYSKQSNTVAPYYAGSVANQSWVADEPSVPLNGYANNPVVTAEFQMVLATDTQTQVQVQYGNKTVTDTMNSLTLYGGEWWGFTYSAYNTPNPPPLPPLGPLPDPAPEPSTLLLFGFGAIGLVIATCHRRRQLTATT